MRLSRLAAAAAVACSAALVPPANADLGGWVDLTITGSRAGRGAVAVCAAVAQPVTAFVEVECSSDIMVASGYGVGAATSSVVGVTSRVVCGYAVADFGNGTFATDSVCRSF